MLDAAEMVEFTEKLIEQIKKLPVLYDRKVMRGKDSSVKEEAWESLTQLMPTNINITVDDVKKRWRTLKDCYSKYLRSGRSSGRFDARYRVWRWSGHMDFFKPFMLHGDNLCDDNGLQLKEVRKRKLNKSATYFKEQLQKTGVKHEMEDEDEVDDASYQAIAKAVSEYTNTPSANWNKTMLAHGQEEQYNNALTKSVASSEPDNYMDPLSGRKFDDIELTFLGYAGSVKKLSPRRQSLVKYRVAKLIMQEELAQQDEAISESKFSRGGIEYDSM